MSNQPTIPDSLDQAKKRAVFLTLCVLFLSYLMSVASTSVWTKITAATLLMIILYYLLTDLDMRRKAAAYDSKQSPQHCLSPKRPPELPLVVERSGWRRKVNSPVVEDAIDHFTRRLISELVTDLWYSRLTPDKEGPEELVGIMNGAFGELSGRLRNINLIDFLLRDVTNILRTNLELFRYMQAKIDKQLLGSLSAERRDTELQRLLAAEDKLHPALFSDEAQHKVLQHIMDGLISCTFKHGDLQCLYFRFTARELLASAVMRPILNFATPRYMNEKIEYLAMNVMKSNKGSSTAREASQPKTDGSPRAPADRFTTITDPSVKGVELIQLNNGQSKSFADSPRADVMNQNPYKDPLLSADTRLSRSLTSLPSNSQSCEDGIIQRHSSGGEWDEKLEMFSRRKTQALAPDHFENLWSKGRDYIKKETEDRLHNEVKQDHSAEKSARMYQAKTTSRTTENVTEAKITRRSDLYSGAEDFSAIPCEKDEGDNLKMFEGSGSSTSSSEEEQSSNVTGLDSPETKVWNHRNNWNMITSHIRHPLESFDDNKKKKNGQLRHRRISKVLTSQKSCKPGKVHVWQEVERTSFLSGDGQDILSSPLVCFNDSGEDSDIESLGKVINGAAAAAASNFIPEKHGTAVTSLTNSLAVDSFCKLRCEVMGANIVKSDSITFAVYSISVTDASNYSWSIKRRFRHFEDLHRSLKEYPEYDLHLPPKQFLSSGLDVPIIQERCKLLDRYVKQLVQLPTISGSVEVWDFLSVDSQTCVFSSSFSIIETLSANLDDEPAGNTERVSKSIKSNNPISLRTKMNCGAAGLSQYEKGMSHPPVKGPAKEFGISSNTSGSKFDAVDKRTNLSARNSEKSVKGKEGERWQDASELLLDDANDLTVPTECASPNFCLPILDLVDVILQLQEGAWIRRKAFWVVKQIIHLGMGDAFDDWVLEKIKLLRRGSVIASMITRVEQSLWPDGIFISKHPKRRPQSMNQAQSSTDSSQPSETSSPIDDQLQQEAERRAKFVYELMIENAPAAVVGLIGRKEYEQCAKDLYYFIQSSVCLKQLVFDLIELLLLSAYPELDHVFKQLREEKHRFGKYEA